MKQEESKQPKQGTTTNPQEREKDGNVFGKGFDKLFGDSKGDNSMSEEESKKPGKKGSIKE